MNRRKLKLIQNALSPDGTSVDFAAFDEHVANLKKGLKEKVQVKTLDDVNAKLNAFRKSLDFEPVFSALGDIEKNLDERILAVTSFLESETTDFQTLLEQNNGVIDAKIANNIEALRIELLSLQTQRNGDIQALRKEVEQLPAFIKRVDDTFLSMQEALNTDETDETDEIKKINDDLNKLRTELHARINGIQGGGNANRDIRVGGTYILSPFTDINLKAGAGTTITYAKNQTTKFTDITITATGSGSGIVRSINSVSTNTVAGATAGTDYVYISTAALTLTLPATVGNTNLYTVKNTSSATITIVTTGADTIDGQTSIQLSTQYTAVDLISDGVSNWSLT